MSSTRGFGTIPGPYGDQGVPAAPDLNPQTQQDDIHAIKEKYVGAGSDPSNLEDVFPFNIAPGASQVLFNDPTVVVNSIIVSCEKGIAKVWLGGSVNPIQTSHIIVPSGGPAPQYMLTQKADRIITIGNDPGSAVNAVGCLTVVRV